MHWRHGNAQRLNHFANPFGHHIAKRHRAIGQHHCKFFPAIARHGVFGAHTGIQAFGNRLQHEVARRVAMRVVDFLEMIDIQHQQQRRFARACHHVDFPLQRGPQLASVGQASQGVTQRQFAQAIDQRLDEGQR